MTLRLNRLKRLLHSPTMVYSVGIHIRQNQSILKTMSDGVTASIQQQFLLLKICNKVA